MKVIITLILMAGLVGVEVSNGASIFTHPGRWIKDTAKSTGEDATRIIKESANVLTLGEIGRQRDREKAEQAKREAETAKKHAEEIRARTIKSIDKEIAVLNAHILQQEKVIEQLQYIKSTAEHQILMVDELAQELDASSASYETLVRIIKIQNADLQEWVGLLIQDDDQTKLYKESMFLKLQAYINQVENIPTKHSELKDGNFFQEAFGVGSILLDFLEMAISDVQKIIVNKREALAMAEMTRASL